MSQRIADKYPEFIDYSGTDQKTSLTLARLKILGDHKIIDLNEPGLKLIYDLLNEKRKALFATSEKVNEISKMGFMLPKSTKEVDFSVKAE